MVPPPGMDFATSQRKRHLFLMNLSFRIHDMSMSRTVRRHAAADKITNEMDRQNHRCAHVERSAGVSTVDWTLVLIAQLRQVEYSQPELTCFLCAGSSLPHSPQVLNNL